MDTPNLFVEPDGELGVLLTGPEIDELLVAETAEERQSWLNVISRQVDSLKTKGSIEKRGPLKINGNKDKYAILKVFKPSLTPSG